MPRKKPNQSRESKALSYAFQKRGTALTKVELNEMLCQAVEQTPAPPQEKEDE
jgi:hypothetical protein